MPKVPPLFVLAILMAAGGSVAVFMPRASRESPPPGAETKDMANQVALLSGQVEYLKGQVKSLQNENAVLEQKLSLSGMKGMPKMDISGADETPDFAGMGLGLLKLRKIRSLPMPTASAPLAEVEKAILSWLRRQQPGDEAPRFGLALAALGWIDKPVDPLPLRAALLARLLGGWYDEETETFLTVDNGKNDEGRPAPDKPLALAYGQLLREYGPTLFPAAAGTKTRLTTDERLAREALLAGDAFLTRFLFGLENPAAQPKPGEISSDDPDHPLNEVPMPNLLRQLSMFGFNRGFEFAQTLHSAGEMSQLNAAYSRPPIQCAEVIEAERYLDNNPLKAPDFGWATVQVSGADPYWDDALGKFTCFTALRAYNADADAAAAAKGWQADRLLIYPAESGPRDQAAWQTLWLTATDAAAFFKAMRTSLLQRYDVPATTDTADAVSLEAQGRSVHLIRNRAGTGVLLIDAASPAFASALRATFAGVSKAAQK